MNIERNVEKKFLKNKTRIYMRIHNEGHVTSLILDDAHGEIELKRRPAGDKIFCNVAGTAGVIFNPFPIDHKKIVPEIKKVYFNPPYTVVIWEDGSKTKIKCQDGDIYDPEKGLALAISKKALGNKGSWYETFKKFISPADLEPEPAPADKPKYKVGDKVLIKIETDKYFPGFSLLKGKTVEITYYDNDLKTNLKYQFNGLWGFEDWIEKKVEK